ncbi:MAG: hypothetical protein R3B09_13655 [Nannocystaceae bacterium]
MPWYALTRYQRTLRSIVPTALHGALWNHDLWGQLRGRLGAVPGIDARSTPEGP